MLRTLTLVLAALIALFGIGLGLFYGLIGVASTNSLCTGWNTLSCLFVIFPLSVMAAVTGGIFVVWYLLKRRKSPHALAPPILAVTPSVAFVVYWPYFDMVQLAFVFGSIFSLSLIIFDRYLNSGAEKPNFDSKVARCIAGIAIVLVIGYLIRYFGVWY